MTRISDLAICKLLNRLDSDLAWDKVIDDEFRVALTELRDRREQDAALKEVVASLGEDPANPKRIELTKLFKAVRVVTGEVEP